MRRRLSLRGAFSDFAQRRGISTRLLILFIVLFAIAVTLAPPTQHYFAQRAQISALEASVASNRAKLLEARAELERWNDPDYVRSQARTRLHFVLPGERQYIILGAGNEASSTTEGAAPINEDFPLGVPWYSRIISSITSVGVGSGTP
ncbi:MAG: FtsB family cell division protein [Candidatus Nanopelagicaceae bacterium]|jgi:cell division protein FtsB|nr:septum formation initiator family protein [Actinomycetota bacterium]NCV83097.1 septum formation initiator family protein [Actinomycetota bacterium]NCV95668.1 septum formation initiator family protein [Actinomycetota bacterium]NCW46801.1 septum formation initiator family protein [Actinomycetota bacterium]NCW75195.1 septum formation initiator family protein [Actinomycetota bacterium]